MAMAKQSNGWILPNIRSGTSEPIIIAMDLFVDRYRSKLTLFELSNIVIPHLTVIAQLTSGSDTSILWANIGSVGPVILKYCILKMGVAQLNIFVFKIPNKRSHGNSCNAKRNYKPCWWRFFWYYRHFILSEFLDELKFSWSFPLYLLKFELVEFRKKFARSSENKYTHDTVFKVLNSLNLSRKIHTIGHRVQITRIKFETLLFPHSKSTQEKADRPLRPSGSVNTWYQYLLQGLTLTSALARNTFGLKQLIPLERFYQWLRRNLARIVYISL